MTHLVNDIYAVEMPEDATDLVIHEIDGVSKIVFSSEIHDPYAVGGDMFPIGPGNWSFICTSKDCTEEQAAGIVWKESHFAFWNYIEELPSCKTAIESLHSLLRANGCDPEKSNYAILKRIE